MSASRERKERANNKSVAQPQKQEKKKVSEGWILAISIIAILVAVFGTVLGIRYYQRNQTVMTVGDKDITVKEFNYFFNQTASNYGNYASYVGIDTTQTIDVQKVSAENVSMMSLMGMNVDALEPYKQEDGTYDITWAGYFAVLAKETAAQNWAAYQAAMADPNYTVSEEVETAISNEMQNLKFYAPLYGMDTDEFIEAQYGDGCNEENYEQYIRVSYVASDYVGNYWFAAGDIDSKYAAAPADFDVVTFMSYSTSSSDYLSTEESEEVAETEESEETEEDTAAQEEAKAQAKAAAEEMEASFDDTAESVSTYADYTRESTEAYITEEAAAWLFETAQIGDVKLFANEDGTTYYVVKLLANDVNYQTSNMLQIYIAADEETEETEETAEDHEGHDHEETETTEETELTAAEKVEAVKAALATDGSEENFRTLASEYGTQSSVDMEDVAYSYLESSISTDALLWVMEGRQAGDYEVFENANGTYILYYMSTSETYRNLSVNATLVSEWVKNMTTTAVDNCKFDLDAAMNGAVALTLNASTQS